MNHASIASLLLLIGCMLGLNARAQQTDETIYRLEIGGGIGMGASFTDVKWQPTLSAEGIARFPLNPRMAIKAQVGYHQMKGSTDKLSAFFPTNPNASGTDRLSYSVSDAIYDASALYELHFLPYGYVRDYKGYSRITPYVQLGIGMTYGGAGKAFTVNVPVGIGVKYKAGQRLNLALDWAVHFSLSDKLDGLEAPLGIQSAGFQHKDHYSALMLTLTYDLRPKCPTCNKN